ncbi:MAG: hypothetical protein HOL61_12130 [Rhodospirillaceae bacterium]|nr:hypothetical protein [Rhodospirillaceae bacterium]
MRTLFLLGILVTLAIIAVKKPDQTAWDAVRDLSGQAKTVLSEVRQPVVEVLPLKPFTISREKPVTEKMPDAPKLPKVAKKIPYKSSAKTQTTTTPAKPAVPAVESHAERPKLAREKVRAARLATKDWSELPAIPVQSRPIHTPKRPSSAIVRKPAAVVSKPLTTPRADFADVKIYYENASRLLDEMK